MQRGKVLATHTSFISHIVDSLRTPSHSFSDIPILDSTTLLCLKDGGSSGKNGHTVLVGTYTHVGCKTFINDAKSFVLQP